MPCGNGAVGARRWGKGEGREINGMSPLFGGRKNATERHKASAETTTAGSGKGWRFSLKGSPRHYDDVFQILEAGGGKVYFGEALTYERGAGVALWRVVADRFDWLPALYEWWAEQERIEPVRFTFHLYLPTDLKYPALDLREHTPDEVAAFIEQRAPYEGVQSRTFPQDRNDPIAVVRGGESVTRR
jgi:hypothetical protein